MTAGFLPFLHKSNQNSVTDCPIQAVVSIRSGERKEKRTQETSQGTIASVSLETSAIHTNSIVSLQSELSKFIPRRNLLVSNYKLCLLGANFLWASVLRKPAVNCNGEQTEVSPYQIPT